MYNNPLLKCFNNGMKSEVIKYGVINLKNKNL